MTRRAADPHERFDQWLLTGARGEPARDLALHASLCAACTARISALDLLTSIDAGRATMPPSLAGARRPVTTLRRAGRFAAAFAGVTVAATLIGLATWRMMDLQGLADRVDANAGETPGQAVLGGTGESSQPPSAEGSAASTSSMEPAGTAAPTPPPTSPPLIQPGPAPRPVTPRPTVSASPSASVTPSASGTTPTGSPTPTPSESETPTPSPTPTPTLTETPTPSPTPSP